MSEARRRRPTARARATARAHSTRHARSTPGSHSALTVGLISDTHGLLRPEAVAMLAGVAHIIHAGDIGDPGVLEQLRALAPLSAVRGNNDRGAWAAQVPERLHLTLASVDICVLHDLHDLHDTSGCRVIVSGHSHQAAVTEREGLLYVNPGSAGPRRFKLPVTLGYLTLREGRVQARIVQLL